MRSINLLRRALVLSLVLFVVIPASFLLAEKGVVSSKGFSLELPRDWIELPPPFQGVVASYGKKGTLATFHITERKLDETKSIEALKWEELFSPQFGSIDIRTENMTFLAGEKAKFCIYKLKPGEFKRTMEGKLPAKYINYVLIHQGKLFSITFADTDDGFAVTYPSFLAVMRTFRFDASAPNSPRRPV